MGVSLNKGGNVSLSKAAADLRSVVVGLGWREQTANGVTCDLDASALLVGADGKVLSDAHFVFFNNLTSPDGSVVHGGDNLVGSGGAEPEDAEQITIDLTAVPDACQSVVFPVSIYEADEKRQSFGQVRGAYIRVVNAADDAELARYDLSEDASTETAMVFGEVYRKGAEWKFRAVGQGYAAGLRGIALDYGVNVS